MKRARYLLVSLLFCVFVLMACHEDGSVKIRNEVSKTVMQNVYWGEVYLGGNLYPGEETEFLTVKYRDEKLPSSNRVSFTVEANGNSEAYSTWNVYELEEGGTLEIVLTDSTFLVPKTNN